MNSSLLKSGENVDSNGVNNNIPYGRFKGYTLKPLPISRTPQINAPNVAFVHPVSKISENTNVPNGIPNRIAPPVPKPPNVARSQTQLKPVKPIVNRSNSVLPSKYSSEVAPALPPMNPGTTARPLISSPILEASTCSAKELISPLRHNAEKNADKVPVRPAPSVPIQPTITDINTNQSRIDVVQNLKKAKDGTLKRIASLLKKDEKPSSTSTLSRNPSKTLDKEKLRNIQISAPITSDLSSDGEQESERSFVNRTQSMRDPSSNVVVKRPNIQTFGSMRQPGSIKRPGSIVGSRPKSPPPPRPPAPAGNQTQVNSQIGTKVCNEYDSCEAIETPLGQITESSPTNSDNIYAVIEEYQSPAKIPIPVEKTDSSGIGLLSEIVNEIENRNLDSIYSVTTLNRKKSEPDTNATYANTSHIADNSANEYINLTPSTTSSGYLRPTSINTPIARVAPVKPTDLPTKPVTNNLSSFGKKDMDSTSGGDDGNKKLIRKQSSIDTSKPTAANKTSAPLSSSTAPAQVQFNRTKTPPNIQTNSIRKRSPSPTLPASNKKPITNTVKSTPSTKAINVKPKTPAKPSTISSNEQTVFKPKWQRDRTTTVGATIGANVKTNSAKSNVASLQQKFESAGCSNTATLK